YAGDVVGLVNPGLFIIGDTLTTDRAIRFDPIPRFEPECFATIEVESISKSKQFHRGLQQLEEEGAVRVLYPAVGARSAPILAACGQLQFEVVAARLDSEYGVTARTTALPYVSARRIASDLASDSYLPRGALRAEDGHGHPVVLFSSQWEESYAREQNPSLELEPLG
ncbi:MAG: hypothetical protein KC432_16240, partial [Thermomicrobiales bacterium]|nr:hypothetical protein [Thermomicrobiales bacterium]